MYLLSLVLGFAAWVLPVAAMLRRKNYTAASFAFCAASLYTQIYQTNILVNKGDWAAVEDTFPAILFAASVLVIITAALNIAAAIVNRKKR